jgi:hypothetical protein
LVTLADSIESLIRGALQATEYKATSKFCYPSSEKVTHIEAWTDALRKADVFGSLSQDLLSTTTAEITLRKAITTTFKCPFLARFDYPWQLHSDCLKDGETRLMPLNTRPSQALPVKLCHTSNNDDPEVPQLRTTALTCASIETALIF